MNIEDDRKVLEYIKQAYDYCKEHNDNSSVPMMLYKCMRTLAFRIEEAETAVQEEENV